MDYGLKPCPFCGSTKLFNENLCVGDVNYIFVRCKECQANGPICRNGYGAHDQLEMARQSWNMRAGGCA